MNTPANTTPLSRYTPRHAAKSSAGRTFAALAARIDRWAETPMSGKTCVFCVTIAGLVLGALLYFGF